MTKNPWIAAVLNFVLWGLGYIYIGRRRLFGTLMLISDIMLGIIYFLFLMVPQSFLILILMEIPFVIISLAFAYDAYKETTKRGR